MERTATLFINGGSQAVRLPKEFRFEGSAVRISREGERVILEPIEKSRWPKSFFERLAKSPLSDDVTLAKQPELSEYRDSIVEHIDE